MGPTPTASFVDREWLWDRWHDLKRGRIAPATLLGLDPEDWLAYDVTGAVMRFGEMVESKISDAVKAEREQHDDLAEQIRKSGGKAPKLSEERLSDVAMEAWYLWVKRQVRVAIGVPTGMSSGVATGDLSALTRQRRAWLVKPATFDRAIDADMDTDDVKIIYE